MQASVLIMMAFMAVQSSLFIIQHGKIDSASAQSFFVALMMSQGIVKGLCFCIYQKRIANMIVKIDKISESISYKCNQLFEEEFQKYRKIVNYIFISSFGYCILFYLTIPLIQVAIAFITGVAFPKVFLFNYWFPFDPYEYYFAVRIYNGILVMLTYHFIVGVEAYIMLNYAKLTVCFKSLTEDIVAIVNDYDGKNLELVVKRLKNKIRLHVQLVEITGTLAEMFSVAYLAHMLCFTVSNCFMIFKAIEDTSGDAVASILLIIIVVNYFFYICYFGEKVFEGVKSQFYL